ncbi:MAG: hypothetical protein Q9161_008203 [Pseudevernia consocians]
MILYVQAVFGKHDDSRPVLYPLSVLVEKLLDENSFWSKWPQNSLHDDIYEELRELLSGASDVKRHAPVLPGLVIEVWENTVADLFRSAADDDTHTPMTPDIVLGVWENNTGDIEAAEAPFPHFDTGLLQTLFRELCASVFRKEGVYDGPEYTECFKFEDGNLRGFR